MLNEQSLRALLSRVARHEQTVDEALSALGTLPFEDLGFAKIDHHRELRRGHPEVIYCPGKTPQQVRAIATAMLAQQGGALVATRADPDHFAAVHELSEDIRYDETGRTIVETCPAVSTTPSVTL